MLWDEPKIFFLERRYFFSIILSEFLKNRVALQKMKWFMFCVAMNFIAAIVLIGAGATELNNLGTSVPALLCIAAGICGLIEIRKNK